MEQNSKIKLAASGDQGSFSEEAGIAYANREGFQPEIVYAIDMEGVLSLVEKGECDLGIFPVVNSIGGLVQPAFDAMGKHRFAKIGELAMDIQHCLMALPNVSQDEISQIVSHPQPFLQCKKFLDREFPAAKRIEWEDTAKAARDLESGFLPSNTAVIAPERAALLFHLNIIKRGIQDMTPNITTFIIVKTSYGA